MKTKCDWCGTISLIQNVGNGCHTCLKGWMVEADKYSNQDVELDDDEPKEWQRGYFGYPSGMMAINKKRSVK